MHMKHMKTSIWQNFPGLTLWGSPESFSNCGFHAPYAVDAAGTGDGTRVGEPSPHTVTLAGTPAQRRRAGGWTEMHSFAIDLGKSAFSSRTCGERLRASPIELRGARRRNVPAFRKKGGSVVGGYGSGRYRRRWTKDTVEDCTMLTVRDFIDHVGLAPTFS